MVREIFLQEINDLPIRKEFKVYRARNNDKAPLGFKNFKKQFLKNQQKQNEQEIKVLAKEKVA